LNRTEDTVLEIEITYNILVSG